MFRSCVLPLLVVTIATVVPVAMAEQGSGAPPMSYEIIINGESFRIEANRGMRLTSQENEGVTYDVALRIAPQQRVAMNRLEFEYEWPAVVKDDRHGNQRTVRIDHELGFSAIVTDLGAAIKEEERPGALRLLAKATEESLQESQMEDVEVGEPHVHAFDGSAGHGTLIRYRDSQGQTVTCVIYLLNSETFSASCVVQFMSANEDRLLGKIESLLNSVRPIGSSGAEE